MASVSKNLMSSQGETMGDETIGGGDNETTGGGAATTRTNKPSSGIGKRKAMKPRSKVWEHFTKFVNDVGEVRDAVGEKLRMHVKEVFTSLYNEYKHVVSPSTQPEKEPVYDIHKAVKDDDDPIVKVVGDRKGAVFGGLVEAPLKPSNKRYQVII